MNLATLFHQLCGGNIIRKGAINYLLATTGAPSLLGRSAFHLQCRVEKNISFKGLYQFVVRLTQGREDNGVVWCAECLPYQ